MAIERADIDAILQEMFDQVPTMTVQRVTLLPPDRPGSPNTIARVDVADSRYVLCEIEPDGRLQSARVIDLTA